VNFRRPVLQRLPRTGSRVAYGVWLMQEQRNGVPTQAGLEDSSVKRIAAKLGGEACRDGALRWPLDCGGQGKATRE
jgi:hypothetical protein